MYNETAIRETVLISVVNITAAETGIVLCNASNEFGNSYNKSVFLITGKIFYFAVLLILCSCLTVKKVNV